MPRKIPVILVEDVSSLGSAGDIITVSEGYARNFLFPQGKAALADETAVKKIENKRAAAKAEADQAFAEAQAHAEALDGTELILAAKRKEEDGPDIFGSITTRHIAAALKEQAKLDIQLRQIVLGKPITQLGTYDATIKLSPDVEAAIKVTVNAEA